MRKVATTTAKMAGITAIGQRLLRPKGYLVHPPSPRGHFATAPPRGQQGPPRFASETKAMAHILIETMMGSGASEHKRGKMSIR